jgi:hypothetical protein
MTYCRCGAYYGDVFRFYGSSLEDVAVAGIVFLEDSEGEGETWFFRISWSRLLATSPYFLLDF